MQVDKSNKLNHNGDVKTAEMIAENSAINSKRQYGNYKSVKDVSLTNQIEKSTDLRSQILLHQDENVLNEVYYFGELPMLQLSTIVDEDPFGKTEYSPISLMSSSLNNVHDSCLLANRNVDDKISLVSINDDACCLVKVAKEVRVFPGKLTKVHLMCDESITKDLLLFNDKHRCNDVNFDNTLVTPEEGRFVVYATSATDKAITLKAGESFCSACVLENSTLSVNENVFTSLLGQASSKSLEDELSSLDFPEHKIDLIRILNRNRNAVALTGESLGRTNVIEHRIELIDNSKPTYVPNFRLPISRRNIVESLIEDMKNQGVIKESLSPYNSPLLLVPKKDGTWRFVVDYRRLSKDTVPDRMPMPIFDEVLSRLIGAKIFSALDLLSGYYQDPLSEESKQCTAFSTHDQHFEFQVMAFGLRNAPLSFVRLMHQVFGDMKNVFVYLDDIIIFSQTITEHFQILEEVLGRLDNVGLKIKLCKCQFLMKELEFLGHTLGEDGVKMQEKKIEAIINYPSPKKQKVVKRFLGIIGYYSPFVRNFATIAYPLNRLLRKEVKFKWEEEEESAFRNLKARLTKAPILTYPDFSKEFFLACDASYVGIGAVLLQKGEKRLMLLAYARGTLSPAERSYSVAEKESLAVIYGLRKFRHTILGFQVQVITDHKPILDLFKKRTFTNNQKFNCYFMTILEFSPTFRYIPGRFNTIADGLSRISKDNELVNSVVFTTQIVDLDLNRVKVEQDRDESIRNIKADLLMEPNSRKGYVLIDEIVYLKPTKNTKCCRIFVPETLVPEILKICRSHSLAGHPGVQKTCRLVARNHFWPHCSSQTKQFVLNCETCQLNKGNVMKRAPLESYCHSNLLPFQCVSMDTVGPLPTTDNGNKFILVFVDFLSRYAEIVPVKNRTAVTVAEALKHRIITRHSCPQTLLN